MKILPLVAIAVLFLSLNVNQAMAGVGDQFFDVWVESANGNAVADAACTISDPGVGILKSGFTDANGLYQDSVDPSILSSGVVDIQCTKDSATASMLGLFANSGQTTRVDLVLDIIVGGESIPIDGTSLILAGAQSTTWLIPVVLSILGIGLVAFSRKSA